MRQRALTLEASEAAPHPEEGALAPVSKGEGPLATEQVMHKIAEQIRRNGGNGHAARIFASPLARRLARERGHRACGAQRLGPAWPHRQATTSSTRRTQA